MDLKISKPKEFRELCRNQEHTSQTSGQCYGFVQANLVILPEQYASDFQKFCQENPKPCPLLEMSEPGKVQCPKFCPEGLDLRTDLPKYKLYKNGKFDQEVTDISEFWREDFVAFLLGCSFSFEESLLQSGLEVRHITEGKNVPMYKTNIPCKEVGIFKGNMVVSMRPYKQEDIQKAVDVTAQFPGVHGAPVYFGLEYQQELGILDINKPDYGDAVTINEDEIPVFWACGVTPQNVITQAVEIPIVITHSPGCMLVTDILNENIKKKE